MSVNIYNSNPNATSEEENFSRVADRGSKLASDTIYSNTTSGLNSVDVQGAIDEVNDKVEDNADAISQINSDLTPIYFQLISSGSAVNIEQQDCWCQGNRVHIAFSATANIAMPNDNVWGIVPTEYRPTLTKNIGYVYIENIVNTYINSVRVESNGYIYQTYSSSVPANARVTFIADYFI